MSKEYFHFKGKYRGAFSKQWNQGGHGHQFAQLKWEWLEISNVEQVYDRLPEQEKVGDFIYVPKIKPKGFRSVDLILEMPDGKSYAKPIEHVVFREQAGPRSAERTNVRSMGSLHLGTTKGVASGEVFFSIPKPTPPKTIVPKIAASKVAPQSTTVLGNSNVGVTDNPLLVPDLIAGNQGSTVPLANAKGCLRKGCMAPMGCIGGLFKALRWLFILGLLIGLFQSLGGWLKSKWQEDPLKTKKGNVQLEDQRLDPKQDTMAPQPWNYLVDHEVRWSDFQPRDFQARYTTGTLAFEDSKKLHNHWVNVPVGNELTFWHDLYFDFYDHDQHKVDSLVQYFDGQRKSKSLNVLETAEMVVTFIQEIPYYLVHDGSCQEASGQGGFVAQYHSEGRPCLPEVVGGVQSPYEFVHNMKGDCDTRSLLGYTLLKRLGIESSVWVSREYGHSIMGVAVPANSAHYKKVDGVRHFGVELTAKGFRVGMIAPEHTDMDNWNVVLY
jgi:hypothetical protein